MCPPDSMRLCVLCVLMFMHYYTVCYFTCTFYAVVRQISMLFIDNKDSVFCICVPCDRKDFHAKKKGLKRLKGYKKKNI